MPDDKCGDPDNLAAMRARPFDTILPRLAMACAAGVVLVIAGRVVGSELIGDVGAVLMAPLTLIAGGACTLVVLLAPAWPLSSLAEKIPDAWAWPFIGTSMAVTLLWWWLVWSCIAAGPGPDY
ncbi:hypothetical protein [Aquabacterium commune]|nr:hypothetical protein [Aquabacterium commune]